MLTGCTSLAAYTVLDPTRTDSCVTIAQVPDCGYDSTVSITGIPNTIMTGSVFKTSVNLTIYTADKLLAATYPIAVTATLSGYPYATISTTPYAVALVVVDPCKTTTISPQTTPIPTVG